MIYYLITSSAKGLQLSVCCTILAVKHNSKRLLGMFVSNRSFKLNSADTIQMLLQSFLTRGQHITSLAVIQLWQYFQILHKMGLQLAE